MTQKDIANEIMSQFAKTNSRVNHVIQDRWVNQVLSRQFNPKEQQLLNPAIKDLVNERLITIEDRAGGCLVLTQKGYDTIYPIDVNEAKENIKKRILQHFEETKSKVNHVIDMHWINFTLVRELNPKEVDLIESAINELAAEGLITLEDRNGHCMVLTQKGFDIIY